MEKGLPNNSRGSDEIDLAQLFQLIGKGFGNIFKVFLRFFAYLKKNAIKLGILAVIGLVIAFGLNQLVTKRMKAEVIVKPNLESKNYLYDVIDELQANILAKDSVFFAELGIDTEEIKDFRIVIEPVEKEDAENTEQDLKYLELLEKFRNDALVEDVVRTEILEKSTLNHRITFFYRTSAKGREYVKKLLDYINSNEYFKELSAITIENAERRIEQNQNLVSQIDGLVAKYSEKLAKEDKVGDGRIVLDGEESLDITGLLSLKNGLIRDTERKKIEILGQKGAIRIINLGMPQVVQKSFFGKNVILIPLILMGLLLLFDILKYINRKANEM